MDLQRLRSLSRKQGGSSSGSGAATPILYQAAEVSFANAANRVKAGNYTVGILFYCLQSITIASVKFPWTGASSKTVKVSIHDKGVDDSVVDESWTGTIAVSANQVYTFTFATPVPLTALHFYAAGLYVNDGSSYIHNVTNPLGWIAGPRTQVCIGPIIYIDIAAYSGGDATVESLSGTDTSPFQMVSA
jgi:hypothetical protein